jgi:hypothetical protein
MRKPVGALVLLLAARCVDAFAEPSLAECAARLSADDDKPLDVCPDIVTAIGQSPFAGVGLSKEDLSAVDVVAIQSLISAFAQERAPRRIEPERLDPILAGLEIRPKPKSLWRLFNEWAVDRWRELVKWLDLRNPLADLHWEWPDWGREVLRSVGWGLFAMLVSLAAIAAFVLARGGPRRLRDVIPGLRRNRKAALPLPSFADLAREPPARRLRLLLRIVLAELGANGRLTGHGSLTHRELAGAATGLDDPQRAALRCVALGAEQATYSQREPEVRDVEAAVEAGRVLVAHGTQ